MEVLSVLMIPGSFCARNEQRHVTFLHKNRNSTCKGEADVSGLRRFGTSLKRDPNHSQWSPRGRWGGQDVSRRWLFSGCPFVFLILYHVYCVTSLEG